MNSNYGGAVTILPTILTDALDPQIIHKLKQLMQTVTISQIDSHLDLVDSILQLNRSSPKFNVTWTLADAKKDYWTLMDGLLKCYRWVVIPESLQMKLCTKVHCQIASAHPGIQKTQQILQACYYWHSMDNDIKCFVHNCHACRCSTVPRDKPPGLLHPLPVPDRLWQHIFMDFKSFPKDKHGFNTIAVFMDWLGKRPISVPCHSMIDATDLQPWSFWTMDCNLYPHSGMNSIRF